MIAWGYCGAVTHTYRHNSSVIILAPFLGGWGETFFGPPAQKNVKIYCTRYDAVSELSSFGGVSTRQPWPVELVQMLGGGLGELGGIGERYFLSCGCCL